MVAEKIQGIGKKLGIIAPQKCGVYFMLDNFSEIAYTNSERRYKWKSCF